MLTTQIPIHPTSVGLGRFAQDILSRLQEGLSFDGFKIQVDSVEIGEDPRSQDVSVDFQILPQVPAESVSKRGAESGYRHFPSRTIFTFTFSPNMSVRKNVGEFRKFVKQEASESAGGPLEIPIFAASSATKAG